MRGISGVSCSPNQIRQSDSDIESWSRQRRESWLAADLKMRKPGIATTGSSPEGRNRIELNKLTVLGEDV